MTDESDLLTQVRTAWAEVLGADDVGEVPLDTNFLETAGSSLLLILLWERLHPLTSRQLRVSDLFQHSTVRSQTALLAGEDDRPAPAAVGANDRGRLVGRANRERR